MRNPTAQLSLAIVALLIGLLLVGQLRSQARPSEVASLSAPDLSTLIETLSTRNRELRSALTDVRDQLRQYQIQGAQGVSSVDVSRQDLLRISAFAGTTPVNGQGISMRVNGSLDAVAVNDLINELRNAGAEAIAVDDTRITARSVATQGARSLEIDGAQVNRSFTIRAIGDPNGLLAALQRPGGIISQLKLVVSATIDVQQATQLTLPKTRLNLTPAVAKPVQ